jgi:hypothetical protein
MFTLVPNVFNWFQAFSWVQGLLDEVFSVSSVAIEFVPVWIRYLCGLLLELRLRSFGKEIALVSG